MNWSDQPRRVIVKALADAAELGLEGKAREKFVQDRYPFYAREYWPYTAWRKAFNELVKGKKTKRKIAAERADRHVRLPDLPGQGFMFEESEAASG